MLQNFELVSLIFLKVLKIRKKNFLFSSKGGASVIIMHDASLVKNSCVSIVLYVSVLLSLHMHAT